jgi:transcriptional regulator with XRE-family HTH domain
LRFVYECDNLVDKGGVVLFGKNLRNARLERGYTLEYLANIYNTAFDGGLSKGTLSKYENGKQEPMISVVANLAKILNVSDDYLLGSPNWGSPNSGARNKDEKAGKDIDKLRNHESIISMLNQLSEDRRRVIENLIVLEWTQQQQK